jgi:hypothetical protein
MSESMAASDVTEVIQMYLDHLSGIIFTWDGHDRQVRRRRDHGLLERAARSGESRLARSPLRIRLRQPRARTAGKTARERPPPVRYGIGINTARRWSATWAPGAASSTRLSVTPSTQRPGSARTRRLPGPDRPGNVRRLPRLHRCRPGPRRPVEGQISGDVPDLRRDRDPAEPRFAVVQFPTHLATQSHSTYTASTRSRR